MRQGLVRWAALGLVLGSTVLAGMAQVPPANSPTSASAIPQNALVQPADVAKMLQSGGKTVIFQVGSHLMFSQAHIPGAEYAGPDSQAVGLDLLASKVAALPKNALIVIYCGCCPWNRCPNMGPAYQRLLALGFTNVKAMYVASNFGDDWVGKGYPVEKGD
ncbi:MAG TPA: rhodanese-like domain-containing protein [Terracidiphilus sp.]|jgi:thiosulfate/3-mercaptopyruvate sulfurtransferase|nr:rhodanese-like domain-containing protein [Terracidiphilus sp.]